MFFSWKPKSPDTPTRALDNAAALRLGVNESAEERNGNDLEDLRCLAQPPLGKKTLVRVEGKRSSEATAGSFQVE